MLEAKCKKCRRIGEKLFLKGDKCATAKCPFTIRPYAPGPHGKKRRGGFGGASEYGKQLKEKQKIKLIYGLRERQFGKYVKEAMEVEGGKTSENLLESLELRLDNVVLKLGLADSISSARQLVGHGHIKVNGRKASIPSHKVKIGDRISIRAGSLANKFFKDIDLKLKKVNPPTWLQLDKEKKEAVVAGQPDIPASGIEGSLNTIIEFYSR